MRCDIAAPRCNYRKVTGFKRMISFSAKVKSELADIMSNFKHCRKAELVGMFQYGGQIGRVESNSYTVGFHTENEEVLKKGFTLLKKTFNIFIDQNLTEQELYPVTVKHIRAYSIVPLFQIFR